MYCIVYTTEHIRYILHKHIIIHRDGYTYVHTFIHVLKVHFLDSSILIHRLCNHYTVLCLSLWLRNLKALLESIMMLQNSTTIASHKFLFKSIPQPKLFLLANDWSILVRYGLRRWPLFPNAHKGSVRRLNFSGLFLCPS